MPRCKRPYSRAGFCSALLLAAALPAAHATATAVHGGSGVHDEVAMPLAAPTDSAAVASVVEQFHRALAAGDSAAALALLTTDVRVLENGNVETRDEYRHHHLPADIAFARAVPSERAPTAVTVRGDVAWAVSSSTTRGRYRDRDINSAGAELMVLVRNADGWRIAAIHWSSRTVRSES